MRALPRQFLERKRLGWPLASVGLGFDICHVCVVHVHRLAILLGGSEVQHLITLHALRGFFLLELISSPLYHVLRLRLYVGGWRRHIRGELSLPLGRVVLRLNSSELRALMVVPLISSRELWRLVLELHLRLGFHRRAWHFWNAETFRVPLVNCVRLLLRRRRWPHELFDHGCLLSDFPDL